MNSLKRPDKMEVRLWMAARRLTPKAPPSAQEIRCALGWAAPDQASRADVVAAGPADVASGTFER